MFRSWMFRALMFAARHFGGATAAEPLVSQATHVVELENATTHEMRAGIVREQRRDRVIEL